MCVRALSWVSQKKTLLRTVGSDLTKNGGVLCARGPAAAGGRQHVHGGTVRQAGNVRRRQLPARNGNGEARAPDGLRRRRESLRRRAHPSRVAGRTPPSAALRHRPDGDDPEHVREREGGYFFWGGVC